MVRTKETGHAEVTVMRRPLSLLAASTLIVACASHAPSVKPALDREDTGLIEFTTPGSLVPGEGGRLVAGPSLVLSGELQTPPGSGPFPGVVLMHGCAGIGAAERDWESVLRAAGYATFVVDSFSRRGLREACVDASALLPTQRIPDAYGAFRILSTHPAIAARRIALMGFSHGGIVTTLSSTTWAYDMFAASGQPSFRAFIAFYPYCNWTFPEMEHLSVALRIHAGALDDWTPSRPCEHLVAALRAAGYDAGITVYPGARHSFDLAGPPLRVLPYVANGAACTPRLSSILGPLENTEQLASCLHKGASIGWNPEATARARMLVVEQLKDLLE
jgi:dienelactone hydrolase